MEQLIRPLWHRRKTTRKKMEANQAPSRQAATIKHTALNVQHLAALGTEE